MDSQRENMSLNYHNNLTTTAYHKELHVLILTAIPTLIIVFGTVAGNVLVCVAIGYSRQLRKNITNAFCASLAIRFVVISIVCRLNLFK